MANEPVLRIRNLTVLKDNFPLLNNVSVEFQSGQVAVILGATGSGKSTLVRAIAGLERPHAGRITLGESDLTTIAAYKRQGIATVLQRPGMFPRTTPRKNIEMVIKSNRSRVASEFNEIDAILKLVDLTDLADVRVDSFSGGEVARVAIARAIAVDPSFLVIDEALSAVDAPLRRRILQALTEHYVSRNKALVFVTHDQLDAFMFADQLVLIDEGKILADGSPREVYSTPPNRCVGEFLGLATPLVGVIENVDAVSGKATALLPELGISARIRPTALQSWTAKQQITVIVRPEDVVVRPIGIGIEDQEVEAYVTRSIFTGGTSYLLLKANNSGLSLISQDPSDYVVNRFEAGERVTFMLKEGIAAVCA